jgi:hypothetical protein
LGWIQILIRKKRMQIRNPGWYQYFKTINKLASWKRVDSLGTILRTSARRLKYATGSTRVLWI